MTVYLSFGAIRFEEGPEMRKNRKFLTGGMDGHFTRWGAGLGVAGSLVWVS